MWPIWLIALGTQAKSFKGNPIIGSRTLNTLGLHIVRLLLARATAHFRWALLAHKMPRELRTEFHENGFCILPDFLDAETLRQIKDEIQTYAGDARQMTQGNTATQRILLDDTALAGRATLSDFQDNSKFLNFLAYCGASAIRPMLYIQRIRNGFREGKTDPQKTMHADTFHPTIKAWLFLEDVHMEDGPFTYVRGSNRLTWRRLKWEYARSRVAASIGDGYSEKGSFRADANDLAAMGLPAPEGLTAKAGTLVIANTNGFHGRGQAEDGANRLEVWAYSRHNPFSMVPGFGLKARMRLEHKILHRFWRHKDKLAESKNSRASWHLIDAREMLD
ncbi:MAG: phytanoyl-CoA dioxygenase family protein [Alphaproteobacteria bacterium]|nr:phytanoyl-CoA dioxygenase family protein [Alphaproteobacteria bacterium]